MKRSAANVKIATQREISNGHVTFSVGSENARGYAWKCVHDNYSEKVHMRLLSTVFEISALFVDIRPI